MRAVWLDVPEDFLEERRRFGHDKKDELWDGVVHMPPPPAPEHNLFGFALNMALNAIGQSRGLRLYPDPTGVYDRTVAKGNNYRIPDGTLARPEDQTKRGLDTAALVVEIISPNDESRDKFSFYAKVGVREVWIIHPHTRVPEIYALTRKKYRQIAASGGKHHSPVLGVTLQVIRGPKLRMVDGDTTYDI